MKTPLYEIHQNLKGKLVNFANYQLPVSYSSVKNEYLAVRNECGIFDISHMAPIMIEANSQDEIINFINYVSCKEVGDLVIGQVQYNALLNKDGGVVDDITVFRDKEIWYLIVNAANKTNVVNHLTATLKSKDNAFPNVVLNPITDYVLMALQGPKSEEFLIKNFKKNNIEYNKLFYYEFYTIKKQNFTQMVSRTGYTGEDGFEILLPPILAKKVFEDFIEMGVTPCGLAARDLLRMEMFYPLYGNDLKANWSAVEGGIGWLIDSNKKYIGKEKNISEKQNPVYRVRGFEMLEGGGVPRTGFPIITDSNETVGEVTSGSFSFNWKKGFGMAHIKSAYAKKNQLLFVDIRGKKKKIRILIKSPHIGSLKKKP